MKQENFWQFVTQMDQAALNLLNENLNAVTVNRMNKLVSDNITQVTKIKSIK